MDQIYIDAQDDLLTAPTAENSSDARTSNWSVCHPNSEAARNNCGKTRTRIHMTDLLTRSLPVPHEQFRPLQV